MIFSLFQRLLNSSKLAKTSFFCYIESTYKGKEIDTIISVSLETLSSNSICISKNKGEIIMGSRRDSNPQADDLSKRPQGQKRQKSNNSVLNNTTTRKGEVFRAQRRTSDDVNKRASQHIINVPVNKSIYNGYKGEQFSLSQQPKRRQTDRDTLKIMPIGGLGEMGIGKNMMAIEYDNEIIVIDCGFLFPGLDYPGINYITPDITYLEQNKHKIKAQVFTHGHLDHIGAYRHMAHRIPAPVYGSKFTLAMVNRTMEEAVSGFEPDYNELDPDKHEIVKLGEHFSVALVRVNH